MPLHLLLVCGGGGVVREDDCSCSPTLAPHSLLLKEKKVDSQQAVTGKFTCKQGG